MEEKDEKGDLLIQDIWTQGMDSIHGMCAVNTDANSYQSKTQEKCLETTKRKNNKKYLKNCINECQHFTTFISLVDGLLGVEADAMLKCISIRLTQQWK